MRISDWSSDVCSSDLLARQARGHRRLAAVARGGYPPADRERLRAVGADFDGNLIARTPDAAAAHFDVRTDVGERFVQHAARFLLGPGLDRFARAIDDSCGDGLLPVDPALVHQLGLRDLPEPGRGQDFAALGA